MVKLTEVEVARLAELRALDRTLTVEEKAELAKLEARENA